jgi:hypothetical protein
MSEEPFFGDKNSASGGKDSAFKSERSTTVVFSGDGTFPTKPWLGFDCICYFSVNDPKLTSNIVLP